MAREFLYLVQESAYGTPVGSPVVGTSSFYIRLDDGNSFTPRMTPQMWRIMYGGGLAVPVVSGSDVVTVEGTLKTKLYASQCAFLLGWAGLRINGGQTSPWTTTEPAGDLASVSAYHARTYSDGSIKRKQYPGGKVKRWRIEGSRDSKLFTLTLDLSFQKVVGNSYDSSSDPTSTVFPAPTDSQLPTDPYAFIHSAGGLTLDGNSSITKFSSVVLESENVLDVRPFELRFPQIMRWLGRTSSLTAKLLLQPSPDLRSVYEAVTANSVALSLANGTHTNTFTFNAQNIIDTLTDDLPLDKVYEIEGKWTNQWDGSAGADLSLSLA